MQSLLQLDPVPELLAKVRTSWPNSPVRVARAPGRLDVMGGIAEYTGAMVCAMPLDCAVAAALQPRPHRIVEVFNFNLHAQGAPANYRISLDELATHVPPSLLNSLDQKWAAYVLGCLAILHEQRLIDLRDPRTAGMNIAIYSTIPSGAGLSSSAALQVATTMLLRDHWELNAGDCGVAFTPMKLAELCQLVQARCIGAPCGIVGQVTSCMGEEGKLLRMVCQPHELLPALPIPQGMRFIGIDSNVKQE
jgi:galactokinase